MINYCEINQYGSENKVRVNKAYSAVNLKLPKETHTKVKMYAAWADISVQEAYTLIIEDWIDKEFKKVMEEFS